MAKPSRDELYQLCLVQRLTEREIADMYGVHRNTVARWKNKYGINSRDWWKEGTIVCVRCDEVIDPDVRLDAEFRKKLLRSKKPMCDECREEYQREYNRTKQAEWRDENREKYNEYMREWRKKNKKRWLEIKRRSAKRNKDNKDNNP